MKRYLSYILTCLCLFAFLFVSCGETEVTTDKAGGETTPETTSAVTTKPEVEKKPISADGEGLSTYENPLLSHLDAHTWEKYGVGDPFVMRYNGRYYLYCSTRDGFVGIQCWVSDDLVSWEYKGICANEQLTKTAYAPEVTYYNGAFYMYTSPGGNGHYVLKSDSPTGPFKAVTGNFGLSIDGHVFIDDNGKWYFYSASGSGIMAYNMTAPDKVSPMGYNTGTGMNGWTEGAMVIKVNGVYYMTYTGNHVLAKGYRINYATSTKTPLRFTPADNNPILLSTSDAVNGIGHSSTVLGPDLDSYYIVYHSLLDRMPNRDMRIDRIVFNGSTMSVLGPTVTSQQAPAFPKIYGYFGKKGAESFVLVNATLTDDGVMIENGSVFSEATLSGNYTAEYNLLSLTEGVAGFYFSYLDENNYGKAYFDTAAEKLVILLMENGVKTEKAVSLVRSFNEAYNFFALQKLTVKKEGGSLVFLVNDRTLCKLETALSGGKIGYFAEGKAKFGFMGGSEAVNGSSVKDYYKPIPGNLQAIDSIEGNQRLTLGNAFAVKMAAGELLNYKVNVATNSCDLGIYYRAASEVKLTLYQNGEVVTTLTLPATSGYETAIFRNLSLKKGFSAITFALQEGEIAVVSYAFDSFTAVEEETHDYEDEDTPTYADGSWQVSGGVLTLDGGNASVGKYLYGSEHYGDYVVEADITPKGSINFGLLVRATNPSLGDAGNSASAGTDFVQGYFIGLSSGSLVLGKQNYNWTTLESVPYNFVVGETYHLSVTVVGATLSISVNGEELLVYTDPTPYLQGMAGVRGHYSVASVDNFVIKPIEE